MHPDRCFRSEGGLRAFDEIGARYEWAATALLVPDVAARGRQTLAELGCSDSAT